MRVCVCVCLLCDCVYIDFRLAPGAICFQSCVGSSVCMRLCVCDTHQVYARWAHALLRSLSNMPGFRLCLHGSVIIQRGKQPAPDLISCLGSHREVGKHYQLITVLPASPAFPLIALPRDSTSSHFVCECASFVCERSPTGCFPRVCRLCPSCDASLWVSHRQQRRIHTWQRQARAQSWGAYAQTFSLSPPSPTNLTQTVIAASLAKPQKALGKPTNGFPIYESAIQQYHHHRTN